jgi:hypothetical protein
MLINIVQDKFKSKSQVELQAACSERAGGCLFGAKTWIAAWTLRPENLRFSHQNEPRPIEMQHPANPPAKPNPVPVPAGQIDRRTVQIRLNFAGLGGKLGGGI